MFIFDLIYESFTALSTQIFLNTKMYRFWVCLVVIVGAVLDSELINISK